MSGGFSLPPALVLVLLLSAASYAQHPPGVEPGESYHRVFATSSEFGISSDPSFPPPFTGINGLAGADWHVTLAAFTGGLIPEWDGQETIAKAILSTSTVDANTRFSIVGKVFNTQDEKIADDAADFWDGSLDAAIMYDENGDAVNSSQVWSGSTPFGNFEGESCGDWTDSSSTGWIGNATTAGSPWVSGGFQSCSNTARIYGISPAVTVPLPLGDANGDGVFNNLDIASFVLALTNPVAYAAAYPGVDPDVVLDMNDDGVFDNFDITPFVVALTGP